MSNTVSSIALGVIPALDRITLPLAATGQPLTRPLIGVTDGLLGNGLGLAIEPMGVGRASRIPLFGDYALLGGSPLVGTLIDTSESAPIAGGFLLGGQNGLFAGTGPIPILGGFFGALL